MASIPTTDDIGQFLADLVDEREIHCADGARDFVDAIDTSDPSNLRIVTANGAMFVVRIIREA